MAARRVEMVIRRNGRQEQRLPVVADVRDIPSLQDELAEWLRSNGWRERHWRDFTAEFHGDHGKPVEVRAVP